MLSGLAWSVPLAIGLLVAAGALADTDPPAVAWLLRAAAPTIVGVAGVALPASFGTSLAAEQYSLAAAQSSPAPEDITLTTPRTTRGLPLIVGATKLVIEAVKLTKHRSR